MFRRFLKEEKAQGAVEYVLLAGGVAVTAVVVLGIYSSMTPSVATALNESVGRTMGNMTTSVEAEFV